MKKALVFIAFALSVGFGRSMAQQPAVVVSDKSGWHKIGETMVDFSRDRDEVMVLGANRFSTIKFKVTDAPIDLVSLEIYYDSGDMQNVAINTTVKAPGESKTIDLNGGERSVKSIIFIYKTIPNYKDKKAHVEIWGLKTNPDKNTKDNMNKDNNMKKSNTNKNSNMKNSGGSGNDNTNTDTKTPDKQ